MKLCAVKELKGGEILSCPVMTQEYNILLSQGTELKKEYVDKLLDLDINEVYIQDEKDGLDKEMEKTSLRLEVEQQYKKKVKDILEKHTYQHNQELIELSNTADAIISGILEKEEVLEEVLNIKERSADLYEHSISCCVFATLCALKMQIPQKTIHDIGVGCLLHDIGLRYMAQEYISLDMTQMSQMELAEFKKHPIYGYSVLQGEKWISEISKNIILYHHEHLDGSGYPLRGKEISKEARIVTVCDTFDEMISGISCNRVKIYEAVEYLKHCRLTKFDPEIVDEFLKFMAVYPIGSQVVLNTGEKCVVTGQNKGFPERPVLQLIEDATGKKIKTGKNINLLKETAVFIHQVLN